MRYRSVLVENEEHSLARLRRILAEFSQDIEVVGEAADGPSALAKITEVSPDLVFLDIELPGFNGFRVLESLETQPIVIFTTAFNQHALDAFKAHAVDYLLKPIDSEAVRKALTKLRAMGFSSVQSTRTLQQLLDSLGSKYLTRIACRLGDRTILVKTGEVLYFKADNKYTAARTVQREFLLDSPLVDLEEKLNPRDFIRIHRSTLVNLAWLSELRRSYDGKLKVLLADPQGTELDVSRSYAENLRRL